MQPLFLAFISYVSIVWGIDILRTVLTLEFLPAVVLSLILAAAVLFAVRKKLIFEREAFTRWDALAFFVIAGIYFVHMPFPDMGWDNISYHILHWQPLPWSQVTEGFFPSTMLHSFLIPLADRMTYPFYGLLGFRLGTSLNLFIVLIVYMQLRQLFRTIGQGLLSKSYGCALAALGTTLSINTFSQLYTYFVDIRTVPILLFFLQEFVCRNGLKSRGRLLFLAWCIGIEFSLKLSAGIPLLLFVAYFLFLSRREVSFQLAAGGVLLAMLPLAPYCYASFLETGSPLFPYMNGIFHSPLMAHGEDAKNVYGDILTQGPQNIFQGIIWPFCAVFQAKPFGIARKEAVLVLMGLAAIAVLWKGIRSREMQSHIYGKLIAAYLVYYLVGASVYHGFMRYNPMLDILSGMLCVLAFCSFMEHMGRKRILGAVFLLPLLAVSLGTLKGELWGSPDSPNPPVYRKWQAAKANAAKIMQDGDKKYTSFDKVHTWLAFGSQPTQGYAYFLNREAPILLLDGYAPMYIDQNGTYDNPVAKSIYEQHMAERLGQGMYILLQTQGHRPTYLGDGVQQETLMGELVQLLLQRGIRLRGPELVHADFLAAERNITMAEAVQAKPGTIFQDYLVKAGAVQELERTQMGGTSYELMMALQPDKMGSVPEKPFSGHVDVYDASGSLQSRESFASSGEYVTMTIQAAGRVEVVFDGAEDARKTDSLLVLCYEKAGERQAD